MTAYESIIVGLRLSVIIAFVWLFVNTLQHHKDTQQFYAGAAMTAAVVLFFAPEHLARLTHHPFNEVVSGIMMICANICLLISAYLSIGLLKARNNIASTKRVLTVGTAITVALIIAVWVV